VGKRWCMYAVVCMHSCGMYAVSSSAAFVCSEEKTRIRYLRVRLSVKVFDPRKNPKTGSNQFLVSSVK
jgi:hypothetical protein